MVCACVCTYVCVCVKEGVCGYLPATSLTPWGQFSPSTTATVPGKSSEGQAEPQAPSPAEPAEGREKFYSRTTQNNTISTVYTEISTYLQRRRGPLAGAVSFTSLTSDKDRV